MVHGVRSVRWWRRVSSGSVAAAVAAALLGAPARAQVVPVGDLVPIGGVGSTLALPGPQVAMAADGSFTVLWARHALAEHTASLWLRRFGADGLPLTPERRVDLESGLAGDPVLEGAPDGGSVVAWEAQGKVVFRRFDGDGLPLADEVEVDFPPGPPDLSTSTFLGGTMAVGEDGAVALVLTQEIETGPHHLGYNRLWVQRYPEDGGPPVSRLLVNQFAGGGDQIVAASDGGYWVLWSVFPAPGREELVLVRLAEDLSLRGSAAPDREAFASSPRLAADGAGNTLLTSSGHVPRGADGWPFCAGVILTQAAAGEGALQGPIQEVEHSRTCQYLQQVAGDASGEGFLVAWLEAYNTLNDDRARYGVWVQTVEPAGQGPSGGAIRVLPDWAGPVDVAWRGDRGVIVGTVSHEIDTEPQVVARLLRRPPADCPLSAGQLCLGDSGGGPRLRVDADWAMDDYPWRRGFASARPLSESAGTFWFFRPDNPELVVKLIDGRPVNGSWWSFFGALSDLDYRATVIDLDSGRQALYHNPPGGLRGQADLSSLPAAAAEGSAIAAEARPATTGPPPGAASLPPGAPAGVPAAATAEGCAADGVTLCFGESGFEARVSWRDPRSGAEGSGYAMPIDDRSGVFWFFRPANVELTIKLLDGRPVNGRWWVFWAATTDLELEIEVVHKPTGERRIYRNLPLQLGSRADTDAFPVLGSPPR